MTTATPAATRKVRIPSRSWIFIEGTQAWADRNHPERLREYDAEAAALWQRVYEAPTRKDGSCTLALSDAERGIFLDYAEAWAGGARDMAGPDDLDALADLNSLRALIRALA